MLDITKIPDEMLEHLKTDALQEDGPNSQLSDSELLQIISELTPESAFSRALAQEGIFGYGQKLYHWAMCVTQADGLTEGGPDVSGEKKERSEFGADYWADFWIELGMSYTDPCFQAFWTLRETSEESYYTDHIDGMKALHMVCKNRKAKTAMARELARIDSLI